MSTIVCPATPSVSIRRIALPGEHGGWSLAGESIALGLIVAPSVAGIFVAIAALMAFLARQPVRIFLSDLYRGRLFLRSKVALGVAAIFVTIGSFSLTGAVSIAGSELLWPILFAFPFAAVQIAFDGANESRGMLPELCGAIAIASTATMIVLASDSHTVAYLLWGVSATRSVTAILYVRGRLILEREKRSLRTRPEPGRLLPAVIAHVGLLVGAAMLVMNGAFGWPLLAVAAVLLTRCIAGFLPTSGSATAPEIGIAEIAYGALFIAITGLSAW